MAKSRRPRPLPTKRGLPKPNPSLSERPETRLPRAANTRLELAYYEPLNEYATPQTTGFVAPVHARRTSRYPRALAALCERFPHDVIIEVEALSPTRARGHGGHPEIDRLVFLTELDGATIDLSTFQAIHECLNTGVPVFLLTRGNQTLVPRKDLRFTFYEKEGSRRFASVEIHYDTRINHKAWG